MGKEYEGSKKVSRTKTLQVPPGFESHTSFRLKRIRENEETDNSKDYLDVSKEDVIFVDTMSGMSDNAILKRCLRHRPWIIPDSANHKSKDVEFKQFDKDKPSKTCLPIGVIRGCPDCVNCLKVTARWRPEDARTDVLDEALVFYPTEEDFKDTLGYIAKIRPIAEYYGICRIVPPSSWKHPCITKEKNRWESSTFATQVQRIDGLQVPYSQSKTTSFVKDMHGKRRRTSGIGLDHASGNGHVETHRENASFDSEHVESMCGLRFSAETFKIYADDFKGQYFCKGKLTDSVLKEQWEPSLEDIEGEYKRIVGNPTEEIEVLCCDNLEAGAFCSGFPTVSNPSETSSDSEIVNSGWNLNNVSTLPGSLLSLENRETSKVLVPRVRMGMCFSTLHWCVEEQHLYSLCYLHVGAPKIWYCIPGKHSLKFQMALKNLSAELDEDQHDRQVKQLSRSALNSVGIPVFRCVQNPREFVLVFPGAYHSGFDCGFNCSETATVAPLDWLPHGQNAVELYRELGRKTSLSHDKLLLRAASEAVKAQWESTFRKQASNDQLWRDARGKEGILTKAFKSRVKSEDIIRKYLCNSSQIRRMDEKFDATSKRECKICLCDLHFSAAGCPCSTDIYSCLNHAKQLCSCGWTEKFFLIRYDISELNMLLEALEGKLSSVFKWAKDKLGLSFNSCYSSKNNSEASRQVEFPATEEASNIAMPNSTSSPVFNIREEMKARLPRSTVSNRLNSNDNSTTSQNAARPSIEEIKARLLRSTVSSKLKVKENATKSHTAVTPSSIIGRISSCSNADVRERVSSSTISNKPQEKHKAVISCIGQTCSFLQMEATSEVSSGSSSEASSEEEESDSELDYGFKV